VRRAALTGDHLRQRSLTVPVDTRDPEDLSLPELERDALDAQLRAFSRRAHVPELEDDVASSHRPARRLGLGERVA